MRIRSFLIEVAVKKRESFTLSQVSGRELRERVKKIWNEGIPEGEPLESLSAVDGSRNKKTYAGYVIYAVGACSLTFKGGSLYRESYLAEIDLLKPEEYSDSRLRILMGIVEAKEALKSLESSQAVMIDGSIVGDFLRPVVFNFEISERGKRWVFERFKSLKENFTLKQIDSKRYYREIEENFPGREFPVVAGFLEYLEYLYCYYRLVEEGKGKIIAVSKRSNSWNHKLDPILPDIAVLNIADPPPGHSEPFRLSLKEKKFAFPGEFEELLSDREFTTFYFRLGAGIYKCETDMEPQKALKVLSYYQVRGYPYPLKEVHRRVKITREDIEEIVRILRHRGVTGREALGE